MSTRAKSEEVKAINQKIIQLAESFAAQMERLNNRRDDVNAGKSKTNKKARTDDNDNVDVDVISEATSTQDELVLVSDVSETASAPGGRGGGGAGAGAAAAANATLFVVRRNVLASGPAHQFSDRQRNLMRFFFNELGLSKPQIANLFGMAGQALNAFAFDADEACLAVARAGHRQSGHLSAGGAGRHQRRLEAAVDGAKWHAERRLQRHEPPDRSSRGLDAGQKQAGGGQGDTDADA
jgi:hypothetical protein